MKGPDDATLRLRAEAFHEFTYPRVVLDPPPQDGAFMRAARVYETEIERLRSQIDERKVRLT